MLEYLMICKCNFETLRSRMRSWTVLILQAVCDRHQDALRKMVEIAMSLEASAS